MPGQFRELLPQPSGRDALEGVHQPGQLHRRGRGDEQVDVLRLPVALHQVATEVSTDRLKDVFQPDRWASMKTGWRYFVTKTKWACSRKTQCLPVRMSLVCPMDQICCVVCSSDTAIGWTQPRRSVRRSPAPSGAPGWSTTTGSGCVRTPT